jgi:hypothetical protein
VIDEVSDPTYAYDFFARSSSQATIPLRFFLPLFKKINPENTPQLSVIHKLTFLKGLLISEGINYGFVFTGNNLVGLLKDLFGSDDW